MVINSYEEIEKIYNYDILELSKSLGITREYWYMIRSGKRKPAAKLIYNLAALINADFEELFIFFKQQPNKTLIRRREKVDE